MPSAVRKPHRATGLPKGRPKVLPDNFDEYILAALCRKMDPRTRRVIPHWDALVAEFRIGRNTLGSAINSLKAKGLIASVSDFSVVGTGKNGTVYLVSERVRPESLPARDAVPRRAASADWPTGVAAFEDLQFSVPSGAAMVAAIRCENFRGVASVGTASGDMAFAAFWALAAVAKGAELDDIPAAWIGPAERPTRLIATFYTVEEGSFDLAVTLACDGGRVRLVDESARDAARRAAGRAILRRLWQGVLHDGLRRMAGEKMP
jgi:hypothetical protein